MTDTQENRKGNTTFLSRGIDYLGDLGAKLRDLQGFKTLAHELIQNADDAPKTTSMVFDIRDDALVVDNNGVFSDCQQIEERECQWKIDNSKGHKCDFHRFRQIVSGDKRAEEGTTGAFGIGFIAVYQITDCPKIISHGRHWILHEDKPENKRIEVCSGCSECSNSDLPGTRFILPYVFDSQSALRKALMADAVSQDVPDKLLEELLRSLPVAMIFLKRLNSIEIKRNGTYHCKYKRAVDDNSLIISQGNADKDQTWHLITGDFPEVATTLRLEHPRRIEEKRSSNVSIAIPIGAARTGVLCACLPTEHKTGLPFHVDADFFPTNDRKRIILDNGYQSEWNHEAIKAAARSIGDNIDQVPTLLGPSNFWHFLEKLKDVSDSDGNPFGKFWKNIEPRLKTAKIIFTSTANWVTSKEAVLLSQKEETPVIPVLEALGLNVVDEDLRPYQSLLRSEAVGVPLLDITRICQAFTNIGMIQRKESDTWPIFLTDKSSQVVLWREIKLLIDRPQRTPKNKAEDVERLKKIAIAPGRDGALWPCGQLFSTDESTITLFQTIDEIIPFVEDDPAFAPLAEFLCSEFTVNIAIERLQELDNDILVERWKDEQIDLKQVFDWFEKHRDIILNDEAIKSAFSSLRIFPSSGTLNKLSDLSITGDFDDPLGLAKLVDIEAIGNHRDFLISLGIQKLDFLIYAKQQLPAALQNQAVLPDKRRNAIKLLASRIGEIKDDQEVWDVLAKTPLVECTDDEFRSASRCYFDVQTVHECLGDDVFFVKPPSDHRKAIEDIYKWIGVADEPRYSDLVTLIQTISQSPYSSERAKVVENIVAHLGNRLEGKKEPNTLMPLKTLAWLPAQNKTDRWYKPDEVYASYQSYLFESQVLFLGIPVNIQQKSQSLLKFIGIKSHPTAKLVVRHLLYCANKCSRVNKEVYRFLNDNSGDPDLNQLINKKCLYLEDHYLSPHQVFWGEHRLGRYRRRLGEDLRAFNKLLTHIGVRDTPNYEDGLSVLREISEEFGSVNKPLDEETHLVLLECWRMLDEALRADQVSEDKLKSLKQMRCIPNNERLLMPPDWVFFENRAGLAKKFDDFLNQNVISKPLGAGIAMEAAGVRPLGSAVHVALLECTNPTDANHVRERILKRRNQFGRVLEGNDALSRLELLENLKYIAVTSLKIKYILDALNRRVESEPESVPAFYHKEEKRLLVVRYNGQVRWTAVARELAVALFPEIDPGKIALQLKAVLAPDSDEEVESELDMSGFPRLDTSVSRPSQSGPIVNTLGEEISSTIPLGQLDGTLSTIPITGINNDGHRASGGGERSAHQPESQIPEKPGKDGTEQEIDSVKGIDYPHEFENAFNRPGETNLQEQATDTGKVRNSGWRRGKSYDEHKERLHTEPKPEERRKETMRTILEGPDEQVREYLSQLYGGKCQICGKTFPERDGKPFFIANYIVHRKKARFVDTPANALCVCADHFAKWQHGAIEAEDVLEQIKNFKTESEDGDGKSTLNIMLCGEECKIDFKEKHLLDLQELLEASKGDN